MKEDNFVDAMRGGQICCEGKFVEHILTVCLFVLTQWLQNICTEVEGWKEGRWGGREGGTVVIHVILQYPLDPATINN